ncbi:MAG: hypothetical protein AUK47_04905 [Deltaproteobacteria bacterium CG2_30_63_29]|nr:MAG: hypothetical protein AUK47_04905 [Deltaproteobacteria bacterium CG2_30_63_29]PJB46156.1 MAG: TetR family transcriptional regulator [Deltaproteobacteria bacterium CG_4_9_14_3_um_filter_63_12]
MAPGKRERILESALRVFARKGFYNAKVSEIASMAGIADGTIYLYFKSKDDLLISLFEDRMDWLIRRLSTELEKCDDIIEKLHRYVFIHLSLALEYPEVAEFITVELRQSAKFVREYANPKFNEYLKILRNLIASGQEEGRLRDDLEPRLVSRAIFGALDELLLTAVLSQRASTEMIDDWASQVSCIFFDGLAKIQP